MDFSYSPKVQELQGRVRNFIDRYVLPYARDYQREIDEGNAYPSVMDDMKSLARSEDLWNMFLPSLKEAEPGTRLSNVEYAPLAEIMGRVAWVSEVFNCSAPDTGNMEILHLFATQDQRKRWLDPLLEGKIRSCFAMTEPDVASSDATNIQMSIRREGDDYVINGRKWFITGALHPNCRIAIVMGQTNPEAVAHQRQSMVIVPLDTPGLEMVRNISVMNHIQPDGHCEMVFRNVRVPCSNLLHEEGGGFAIAQARLGPGRIHHCMRSIGQCELALEMMIERAAERKTFGRYLHQHGQVADWIALSRIEIDQARLLVLKAAWLIDQSGNRSAAKEVAMIKAIVPRVHVAICDRAMQVFGAMGLSPDTPLANMWTNGRTLRILDGPDEVHLRSIARAEVRMAGDTHGATAAYMSMPEVLRPR